MSALKQCPCGQIPEKLAIVGGHTEKYAYVVGECCGEWHIEFRTDYQPRGSSELHNLAEAAWNGAPRGAEVTTLTAKGETLNRNITEEV